MEEEGDIIFYKNKHGEASRFVAEEAVKAIKDSGFNPAEQDKLDKAE